MNKEQLMNKVNKLLALAGNNPSQEEAVAAFKKAQTLIAEYNLNMDEFQQDSDKIVMLMAEHKNNNGYRVPLANVIAKNFRCRSVICGNTVAFVGYSTDAKVAVEVFNYAYKVSRRNGQKLEREARKIYGTAHGVFNSYVEGFIHGIKTVLDENCRALAIVIPDEVHADVKRRTEGKQYKGGMRFTGFDGDAYSQGRKDGRSHMRSRQIEN